MTFFGRREGVLDLVLLQRVMQGLRRRKEAVRLTARDVEDLQLLVAGRGIREQIFVLLIEVLAANARAESSDRVERVQVVEADRERLAPTHGKAGDGAFIGL